MFAKCEEEHSANISLSKEEANSDSHHITSDAKLALERLIVGRECNNFDRLHAGLRARAFTELMELGLIKGTTNPVAGRSYPDVMVQRVTSSGRRAHRHIKRRERAFDAGKKKKIAISALILVTVVCLLLALIYSFS